MNIVKFEEQLRNEMWIINNRPKLMSETSEDIWGKEIRRYQTRDGKTYESRDELENWFVKVSYIPTMSAHCHIDRIADAVKSFEREKICKYDKKLHTVYQLCDWVLLTDEEGHIVTKGYITAVKYAKVLPNTIPANDLETVTLRESEILDLISAIEESPADELMLRSLRTGSYDKYIKMYDKGIRVIKTEDDV